VGVWLDGPGVLHERDGDIDHRLEILDGNALARCGHKVRYGFSGGAAATSSTTGSFFANR